MIKKNPLIFGLLLVLGGAFVLYTWWGNKTMFGAFGSLSGFFALGVGLWNLASVSKK